MGDDHVIAGKFKGIRIKGSIPDAHIPGLSTGHEIIVSEYARGIGVRFNVPERDVYSGKYKSVEYTLPPWNESNVFYWASLKGDDLVDSHMIMRDLEQHYSKARWVGQGIASNVYRFDKKVHKSSEPIALPYKGKEPGKKLVGIVNKFLDDKCIEIEREVDKLPHEKRVEFLAARDYVRVPEDFFEHGVGGGE